MERIIAVDCGKDDTKVVMRQPDGSLIKCKLPTRVAPYSELSELNRIGGAKIQVVEFEGKKYSVGDPTGITNDSNSKMDEIHKIMTLSSIAMNVSNGDTVKIAIGCPLSVYSEKEQREAYLNYILPTGRIEMIVDGKQIHFYIIFKTCFAESFGALFLYPERFDKTVLGVVDIGGLNINCAYFNCNKLIIENCFTDKYGKLHIARKLNNILNQKYDVQFKIHEIETYMKNGFVPNVEDETRPIISKSLSDNVDNIINACKSNGWNIHFCNLIFIGGTSQLLKEYIQRRFPNAFIPDDSCYINALGFMKGLCAGLHIGINEDSFK